MRHLAEITHYKVFQLILLLLATAAASAWAGSEGTARTVPRSPNLVSGEVVVSNQIVKFSVLDGAMLKVRLEDEGTQFGIVPTLAVDSDDPALSITVFKITEVKPGSETLEELETLTLDELTAVVKPRAEGIDSVKIAGVRASGMSSDDFATVQREAMGLQ